MVDYIRPVYQVEALLPWNVKAVLDDQKKKLLEEQKKKQNQQQSAAGRRVATAP